MRELYSLGGLAAGLTLGWVMSKYAPVHIAIICAALATISALCGVRLGWIDGLKHAAENTPKLPPPAGPSGRVPGWVDESN